jgi:LPXTG-motif cell wall-anchored protein
MKNKLAVFGCVVCVMLVAVFAQVSQAQTWDKKTRITVNECWSLPGNTVLQPGTYVMRLYDSPSNRQMVEIWNADETTLEARVIGLPAHRLAPSNDTVLNFYERKTQGPAALQLWYHPGDLSGVEFPVPESAVQQLAQIEVKAPEPAPQAEQPPAITEVQPPAPPEPAPEPQPQPEAQPPQIVENVPPPLPPQPELPRTASDAPILALIGLLSLGGGVLLRSF